MGYGGVSGGAGYGGGGGGGGGWLRRMPTPSGSDTGGMDASVPSDILSRAKSVALHGGPGAVEQFMAQQGYPKRGAWCGEFAASVVKSVGGTPPKGASIASNWRNWGEAVEGAPQPGDIAVRKGARTGSTGSHVTVRRECRSRRPAGSGARAAIKDGRSELSMGGYEFRRSTGAMPNGQTAGPGWGAGAGDTPATAHGADGAGGITGRTSIAQLEKNEAAQAAIGKFRQAFPNLENAKGQIYDLVKGESGMGRTWSSKTSTPVISPWARTKPTARWD